MLGTTALRRFWAHARKALKEMLRKEPPEVTVGELKLAQAEKKRRQELASLFNRTLALAKTVEPSALKTAAALEEAALRLELLFVLSLYHTRALFQYLEACVLAKHPTTEGRRGSEEATWDMVLQHDPQLKACLRQRLGPVSDLAKLFAATHHSLCNAHVERYLDAWRFLEQDESTIIFHTEILSREQSTALVCLGEAVGFRLRSEHLR